MLRGGVDMGCVSVAEDSDEASLTMFNLDGVLEVDAAEDAVLGDLKLPVRIGIVSARPVSSNNQDGPSRGSIAYQGSAKL